jgi:N-acylneuraminate cytidylyltransferase
VLGVLNSMGVDVKFKRPDYLAEDNVPLMDVIRYVLTQYENIGLTFDQVWLFLPCSPFVTQADIQNARIVYESYGMEYPLMTVKEYETSIQKAFIFENQVLKSVNPNAILKQSQQLSKFYHDSGNFAIFPREYINKEDFERININFLGYEMPRERGIDIDTLYDWALAEKMYEILP